MPPNFSNPANSREPKQFAILIPFFQVLHLPNPAQIAVDANGGGIVVVGA